MFFMLCSVQLMKRYKMVNPVMGVRAYVIMDIVPQELNNVSYYGGTTQNLLKIHVTILITC